MCLNVIFLTCPVILVLRYIIAIRSSFIFESRLFAIFSVNMSVHAQERYVHSSHHQFQSLAVASQTQLGRLVCVTSHNYGVLIIVLLNFI